MFTPTVTNYFATYKGEAAIIMGYEELAAAPGATGSRTELRVLVSLSGGELVLAELADVRLDWTKLKRL